MKLQALLPFGLLPIASVLAAPPGAAQGGGSEWHGLQHAPLGQAVLGDGLNDALVISNIGSSGMDGVRVPLDYASGIAFGIDAGAQPPIGAFLNLAVIGDTETTPGATLWSASVASTPGGVQFTASADSATSYDLFYLLDGVVVAQSTGLSGILLTTTTFPDVVQVGDDGANVYAIDEVKCANGSPPKWRWYKYDPVSDKVNWTWNCWAGFNHKDDAKDCGKNKGWADQDLNPIYPWGLGQWCDAPYICIQYDNHELVYDGVNPNPTPADEVVIVPHMPYALATGWPTHADLTVGGLVQLTIDEEDLYWSGQKLSQVGDATLLPNVGGSLQVGNLGSSGMDGVRIAASDSASIQPSWESPPAGVLPDGAWLAVEATGEVSGAAGAALGSLTVQQVNGEFQAIPDFSAVGASTHRVDLVAGGAVVATLSGQTGVSATFDRLVESAGVEARASNAEPAPAIHCALPTGSSATLPGVGTFATDFVRFVAEGPAVEPLNVDELVVRGANLGSLVFSGIARVKAELSGVQASASISAGGVQDLALFAGAENANGFFMVLGSASGTGPAFPLGNGESIPLGLDPYFLATVQFPTTLFIPDGQGFLDEFGRADAHFDLPPGLLSPALGGLALNHAYVIIDLFTGAVPMASNPVPVVLTP